MALSIRRAAWLVPALVLSSLVTFVGPTAAASCAEAVPLGRAISDAPIVFVGSVTHLQFDDRMATFQVDEIWKGEIGASVLVSGGPRPTELVGPTRAGQSIITSADRTYELGRQYLVISYGSEDGVLLDNACSATQLFEPALMEHRPVAITHPTPEGPDEPISSDSLWMAVGSSIVGAAIVGAAVALRRRNRRDRLSGPMPT